MAQLKVASRLKVCQCESRQSFNAAAATVREQHGRNKPLCGQNAASSRLDMQNAGYDIPGVHLSSFSKDPRI